MLVCINQLQKKVYQKKKKKNRTSYHNFKGLFISANAVSNGGFYMTPVQAIDIKRDVGRRTISWVKFDIVVVLVRAEI